MHMQDIVYSQVCIEMPLLYFIAKMLTHFKSHFTSTQLLLMPFSVMEMDVECPSSPDDTRLPSEWLHHSAKVCGSLVHSLQHIGELAQGRFVIDFN
jgi:hypothetical protein